MTGPKVVESHPRFDIMRLDAEGALGITCHTCHHTSWNPNDVLQHYCGFCRMFHDDQDQRGLLAFAFPGALPPPGLPSLEDVREWAQRLKIAEYLDDE